MALAADLSPTLTLTLGDNNGKQSNMLFYFPTTVTTIAAAITRANALRDAVAALTNARILAGAVNFSLSEDTPGSVLPESEVERKLVLPFRGANRRQTFVSELPSVIFGVETAGTDVVDATNAAVADYIAAVIANAVTNRGEAIVSLGTSPYIDHRNRRKA
jgi:hypothetical protein